MSSSSMRAVYNYDGDVYAADEGRMLAEMGDTSFRLGNVHADSYADLFGGGRLRALANGPVRRCCRDAPSARSRRSAVRILCSTGELREIPSAIAQQGRSASATWLLSSIWLTECGAATNTLRGF